MVVVGKDEATDPPDLVPIPLAEVAVVVVTVVVVVVVAERLIARTASSP